MTDKDKECAEEIKVTDKRRFTQEGERRTDSGTPPENAPPTQGAAKKPEETGTIPDIDFPTFILSLATSAQVHLGAIPNPANGKKETDLTLAKQTIDILGIIQEKTKGNLSSDEQRLLDHILYDLRMMYVEIGKKPQ